MKQFHKLLIGILAVIAAIFVIANMALSGYLQGNTGRPYRVEVNRLVRQIEQNGQISVDVSQCQYVYRVQKCSGDAGDFDTDSDYLIRQVGNALYRFDYHPTLDGSRTRLLLNIGLGAMTLLVLGMLLFIRQKILRPFRNLSTLPYELSKGNLTVPVQESKYRFFGRFLWGINALRETMEQQKQRELALQREKQTLLLSLSHDIKTPLSAIKLYSKALSKGLYTDPEKLRQILLKIDSKTDELERYVAQITAAAGEEFLSLEVTLGEFYLNQLVEQVDDYYRDKLMLLKTGFQIGAYQNCLIRGDLDRSVEVIQNLMENAIKYGNGNAISLEIAEEEGCILLSVENDGCSLSASEIPHIFDSFWRGSNAQNHQGSGLGLYICRQLMHKMNGDIFSETKGSKIRVTAVFPKV